MLNFWLKILLFSYYLKNNNYSNLDQKHSGNANNDFQTYAQNLFDEQLLSDSLSMHFYIKTPDKNIRNSPVTLGDFSYDSMVKSQQYYINQINLLKDFNYKKLSQKEQLTYDVLLDYFRNQLDYGDLCLCNPVLSPTTGIQAQLPILFAEYTFADKKDIDNYLTLVSQINAFFNQICEFQILKAKNNSFLGSETCNLVIKQCISFLAETKPKDNLFHTSFVSKISNCKFLSDSEKNNYINKNLDLINSSVFPGYNKIISSLKDLQKSGYCKNNKGICHLKNGKSYYEFLVKNYTGSSKSVLELKSDIQSRLMKDMRTMYSILTVNPELENMFYSEEHNSKSPQAILKELNSSIDFDNEYNWLKVVTRNTKRATHPLRHLLLIEFLCDDIKEFFSIRIRKLEKVKTDYNIENCNSGKLAQYKNNILIAIKENNNMKRTELREMLKKEYIYLYRYDKQWLFSNLPKKIKANTTNKRVNWNERDNEYLDMLTKKYNEIKAMEKPLRITNSSLAKPLGILANIQKKINKLPKTKEFLENVYESIEEFQLRRCKYVIDQLVDDEKELKLWQVQRIAAIRTNEFNKLKEKSENEYSK